MLRKLTGLFILFSFLLVKGNLYAAMSGPVKMETSQHAGQGSDADDEKELKNLELSDEFIHHAEVPLFPYAGSEKLVHTSFCAIPFVHFPVWGPPPNVTAFYKA